MSTAVTIISLYCRRRKNGLHFILLLVREQIFISIFYYVVKLGGAVAFILQIRVHSCLGRRSSAVQDFKIRPTVLISSMLQLYPILDYFSKILLGY